MNSDFNQSGENRLLARLLIAKPHITLTEIRQLVPGTSGLDDHRLSQKIEYARRKRSKILQFAGTKGGRAKK